jgi:hypothetical protein
VNFIAQHEAEKLANAGPSLQQIQGLGIVVLGGFEDRECEVLQQLILIGDERQSDLKGLVHGRIVKALGDPRAVGLRGDFLADLRHVVLRIGMLHMGGAGMQVDPAVKLVLIGVESP